MQIKTKNLSHTFDIGGPLEFKAVNNVTVSFTEGEFVTVIGETGSGKTTFIEHLNALLRPTSGEIIIDDFKVVPGKRKLKKINKIRKKVGIVFQFAEYQLFEDTIEKDIIFGPLNMGINKEDAKKLARKYIKLVGLSESFLKRSPFSLSGGQKRRVALAGILAMEPNTLIFDEPTAGLDPQGEMEMYKIFQKLHKLGKTIIIVTHNLDHVLEFSKRTLVFKDGELKADGNSVDIMYNRSLLKKLKLEPPKLANLVWELERKNLKIGKIKSINELAKLLTR